MHSGEKRQLEEKWEFAAIGPAEAGLSMRGNQHRKHKFEHK